MDESTQVSGIREIWGLMELFEVGRINSLIESKS